MIAINEGIQGAKRQSTKANPMRIVHKIISAIKDGGDPTDPKYAKKFRNMVEADPDSINFEDIVWLYYWVNAVARATRKSISKTIDRKAEIKNIDEQQARIMQRKLEAKFGIMFLESVMPNGKFYGDCTRADLVKLSPRLQKANAFLIKTLKPRETVRSRFKTNTALIKAAGIKLPK